MGLNNEHVVTREYLVFDIETAPMPGCDAFIELGDPPKNYVNADAIANWRTRERTKRIAEAGLDLDLCEVVAIAYQHDWGTHPAVYTRQDMDERALLKEFWHWAKNCRLIGFNIRWFDLPVLLRRSLYLGIEAPSLVLDKYRTDIVDLADILSFGRRDLLRSLGFYARRLGLSHEDSVDGSQIAHHVAAGAWDVIAAHARDDVQTTVAIARRLGLVPQASTVEAVL